MAVPVLVCGSVAFDSIAIFEGRFKEHILADHIHSLSVSFLVPRMRKEYGGCAGNISYGLNLLGGQPILVATVGEDAEQYRARLNGFGINTQRLLTIPDTFTANCFITTDLDGNQITAFHPGAMAFSAQNILDESNGAGWAIVAPDSKAGMFVHAQRLYELGIPFIFDLGQAMPLFDGEDLKKMLGLAQVLTLNDYEGEVVEQRIGQSLSDLSHSLQAVIITQGASGATVLIKGEEQNIPAVRAKEIVDPTGCGDAHRAGLLYGLTQQWSWADCCRLGNLMGALKIATVGPQNYAPTREEIAIHLMEIYGLALPEI